MNDRVCSYPIYFIDLSITFFKIDFIVSDFNNREYFFVVINLFSPKCL